MTKFIGTGNNQIPTNAMLGGMAFQSPEDVQVDKLQENRLDVVSRADIGTEPNQIPLNQMLGLNAYTNLDTAFGSWVPQILFGTSEPNYDWRYGQYFKIGRMVWIHLEMGLTSGQTLPSGVASFSNLPYQIQMPSGNEFYYVQIHGYNWGSLGYGDSGSSSGLFAQVYGNPSSSMNIVYGGDKNQATNAQINVTTVGQRLTLTTWYPTTIAV